MSANTIIVIVITIVFFILALVAIFRYDKVKHTFHILGIKIGITGSKDNKKKKTQGSSEETGESMREGRASVRIEGKVADSSVSAKGSDKSKVEVGKSVKESKIRSEGQSEASLSVKGDVEKSKLDAKSTD